MIAVHRNVTPGSSPLARGLLTELRRLSEEVRIIPARAGFTIIASTVDLELPDHPRSRGVYSALRSDFVRNKWIIPARAGFTTSSASRWPRTRDHPRSRGVYAVPGRPSGSGRDHPRSRGVYDIEYTGQAGRRGSSPLARGLRRRHRRPRRRGRIIPARAGFTGGWRPDPPGRRDHPRSRGVYVGDELIVPMPGGSSPLARGLRGGECEPVALGRIIPARAGFTLRCRAPPRWPLGSSPLARGLRPDPMLLLRPGSDHPRSRGVYEQSITSGLGGAGSSPLARGLRALRPVADAAGGIIPARAGFTLAMERFDRCMRDHPRSRGVYTSGCIRCPARVGSSPLARGLRTGGRAPDTQAGIIPARAGFTRENPKK